MICDPIKSNEDRPYGYLLNRTRLHENGQSASIHASDNEAHPALLIPECTDSVCWH
ncbi:hypothetical protein F01_200142 [Burkholderia cenocepacia]|nr:hypothetical protein F01_200142 [Burkholderia cenocepacia]